MSISRRIHRDTPRTPRVGLLPREFRGKFTDEARKLRKLGLTEPQIVRHIEALARARQPKPDKAEQRLRRDGSIRSWDRAGGGGGDRSNSPFGASSLCW